MKLYRELDQIIPAYQYLDDTADIPQGYEDVTDNVLVWGTVKQDDVNRDFLYRKEEIRRIAKAKGNDDEEAGFNTLTNEEKLICCKFEIGTHEQRLAIIGNEGIIGAYLNHQKEARACRQVRVAVVFARLNLELTEAEKMELKNESIEYDFYSQYVIYGKYGSNREFQTDGVYDWIYGLNKFTGIGVIDTGYVPANMTLQELVDYMADIFFYGNYTTF